MATIDKYSVQIDTASAARSLTGLTTLVQGFGGALAGAFAFKEITRVSTQFENLRVSLQLLYRDSAKGNAVFSDIQKFASTSVFSVADLTETVIKLRAAGLTPTIAQLRLFADVSSVAADQIGALKAITDLYARTTAGGLGLEDLNRLADRGIPVFAILSEELGISRLQISKLGQTTEGATLILKALEVGLQKAFGGASEARANTLGQAMSNLGDSFQGFLDLIGRGGLNEGFGNFLRAITQALSDLKPLAVAIGVVLGSAFNFLAENIKTVLAVTALFFTIMAVGTIIRIAQGVIILAKAFAVLNGVIGKNPFVRVGVAILGFLAGMYAAATTTAGFSDKMEDLKDEFASINEILEKGNGLTGLEDGTLANGMENLKGQVGPLNDELKKFRVELDANTASFAAYNQEIIDALDLETSLLGSNRASADIERKRAEIAKRTATEVRALREQRAKLTQEELKQGRGGMIDKQIEEIQRLGQADSDRIEESMRNNNEQSRMFSTGWKQAFEEYADNATNAARTAERLFTKAMQGMEDALVGFAKTGKFEWKNFVNMMLEELLRAQIQSIFVKMLGGMSSGMSSGAGGGKSSGGGLLGGLLGGASKLFGGLFGGDTSAQQGPTQSGGNLSGNTGGIFNSLGGGISKLFSGFFADGGTIPQGRFGIVGEAGAEFVGGPATVTPMSGTNVTYNINAVDAQSFKAMIARDPQFLYAVTMQGAKSIPGAR